MPSKQKSHPSSHSSLWHATKQPRTHPQLRNQGFRGGGQPYGDTPASGRHTGQPCVDGTAAAAGGPGPRRRARRARRRRAADGGAARPGAAPRDARLGTRRLAPCRLDDRAPRRARPRPRLRAGEARARAARPDLLREPAVARTRTTGRRGVARRRGGVLQRVEFRAANRTAAEGRRPAGASHVFYAVHADMFADRRVRHFFYTKDNAPIRARWADAPSRRWFRRSGSGRGPGVGPVKVDERVIRHVNGNAATTRTTPSSAPSCGGPRAAPRMHARLDPYDLARRLPRPVVPDGPPLRADDERRVAARAPATTASPSSPRTTTTPSWAWPRGARAYPFASTEPTVNADRARRLAERGQGAGACPQAARVARRRAARPRRRRGAVAACLASPPRGGCVRESRPGKRLCLCAPGLLILPPRPRTILERNHRPGRAGGPGGASRWAPTAAGAARPVKLRAAVDLVVPPSVVGGARISQGAKRP